MNLNWGHGAYEFKLGAWGCESRVGAGGSESKLGPLDLSRAETLSRANLSFQRPGRAPKMFLEARARP